MSKTHAKDRRGRRRLEAQNSRLAALAPLIALVASGCGSSSSESSGSGGSGAASAGCTAADCSLDCDQTDTWQVLSAKSAGVGGLENLGDADTASPAEVGDGRHHLFVGVAHPEITDANSWGAVLIHDGTADTASGTYVIGAQAIVETRDDYDRFGIEVPSYLRFDATTEYLYYCGLYASYEPSAKGKISALKRVDGAAWQKLGPVAPLGPGSTSQCEPEAVLDPASGTIFLFLIADGDAPGMRIRSSKDPESFPVEGEVSLGKYYSRIGASRDPFANVWRYCLDIGGYPHPIWTAQSWSNTLPPSDTTLQENGEVLHQGAHDLHPALHSNGATVSQTAGAFYPNPDEVIFFYTGELDQTIDMRVHAQRCRRR